MSGQVKPLPARSTARPERGWAIVQDRPGEYPMFALLDVGAALPAPRLFRNPHEAERVAEGLGRSFRVVCVSIREDWGAARLGVDA